MTVEENIPPPPYVRPNQNIQMRSGLISVDMDVSLNVFQSSTICNQPQCPALWGINNDIGTDTKPNRDILGQNEVNDQEYL